MNKIIYNNNLKALKNKYSSIYEYVISDKIENDINEYIEIEKSLENEVIVKVTRDSREYYLNSRYSDSEISNKWIEKFKNIHYKDIFIMFGSSNFTVVKKIKKKIGDENIILIFEPDKNIFFEIINYIDIVDIINDKRFFLCVDEINNELAESFIQFLITYSKIKHINCCCMHNYELLYSEQWKKLCQRIKIQLEYLFVNRNTEIHLKNKSVENMFFIHKDIFKQYLINQLLREFRCVNRDRSIPAIIVSAGPSLDKNIEGLKKAVGKAFIIVVDSALKSVYLHDIRPDITITIDPEKDAMLFMNTAFLNCPIVVHSKSNKEILNVHNGKRFYFDEPDSYISLLIEETTGVKITGLETGGSVANNAFGLAHILGFKKIILIGQDLAYTGEKVHASDAYGGDKVESSIYENSLKKVEDVFGNQVLAPPDMEIYRKWFENKIVQYPYLEVIDATEGGAKIEGTKIMTLKEAIETYCIEEFDAGKIIESVVPMFDEEKQKLLSKKMDSINVELDEEKKKIEQGIRKYERLEELFRANKINKEFKTLVKEVGELSVYIDSTSAFKMVNMYNRVSEYEVLLNAYNTKDNQNEEIKEIIDNGKKILNSYIEGIKELKSDIDKIKNIDKEDFNRNIELLMELISNELEKKEWNIFLKEFYNLYLKVYFVVKNYKEYVKEFEDIDEEMISALIELLNELEDNNIVDAKECIKTTVLNILSNIKILI